MQNTDNTQRDLAASVATQIDTVSFAECFQSYEASAIEWFVVITPEASLAEVGAGLLGSKNALADLSRAGQPVRILAPLYKRLPPLEARDQRAYAMPRLGQEVRALFLPPLCLVQFTGQQCPVLRKAATGDLMARLEAHVCYGQPLGQLTQAERGQFVHWAMWPEDPQGERAELEGMCDHDLARAAYRGLEARYS